MLTSVGVSREQRILAGWAGKYGQENLWNTCIQFRLLCIISISHISNTLHCVMCGPLAIKGSCIIHSICCSIWRVYRMAAIRIICHIYNAVFDPSHPFFHTLSVSFTVPHQRHTIRCPRRFPPQVAGPCLSDASSLWKEGVAGRGRKGMGAFAKA